MNKETLDLHKYVRETTMDRDYYMKETQNLIEKKLRLENLRINQEEELQKVIQQAKMEDFPDSESTIQMMIQDL